MTRCACCGLRLRANAGVYRRGDVLCDPCEEHLYDPPYDFWRWFKKWLREGWEAQTRLNYAGWPEDA